MTMVKYIGVRRIPTFVIVLSTTLVLFAGLYLASLREETAAQDGKLQLLSKISPDLFLGIGIPVMVLEALFWTVAFVELTAKFTSLWLGAFAGVLSYGVAYHWNGGLISIFVSGWIALVLNVSYVLLRSRSRRVAVLSTVFQKVVFIIWVAAALYAT
ncbi:MAG: hypothetical protein QM718_05695 [Steroidobacteraceae bacterium]